MLPNWIWHVYQDATYIIKRGQTDAKPTWVCERLCHTAGRLGPQWECRLWASSPPRTLSAHDRTASHFDLAMTTDRCSGQGPTALSWSWSWHAPFDIPVNERQEATGHECPSTDALSRWRLFPGKRSFFFTCVHITRFIPSGSFTNRWLP